MGFLKRQLALGKIADAHDAAIVCFDTYADTLEINCLKTAAWFIKAGVVDLKEKHKIKDSQAVSIHILGRLVNSTAGFVLFSCYDTLSIYLHELDIAEQTYIMDILQGGDAFNEVELEIPYEIQEKYERK